METSRLMPDQISLYHLAANLTQKINHYNPQRLKWGKYSILIIFLHILVLLVSTVTGRSTSNRYLRSILQMKE